MTRVMKSIALLMLFIFPGVAVARPDQRAPGGLYIGMEGELLTVKAKDIPLRRILEGLARQLGFELIVVGALDGRRSLEVEAKPWEQALKKVLAPASWAFVYKSVGGQSRLAKVFVFPAKEQQGSAALSRSIADLPTGLVRPSPQRQRTGAAASSPHREAGVGGALSELFASDDDEMRAVAIVGLTALGGEQAAGALHQALQDKEPWIRQTAIEALEELGGAHAIQGLQYALRDENPSVRKAAQEALDRLQQSTQ